MQPTEERQEPEQPAAIEREEVSPEDAAGRRVTYEVEVEDTGKTAKITVDAGTALEDYNQRVDIMNKLLECLRK